MNRDQPKIFLDTDPGSDDALAFRETGGQPGFLVHDAVTLAYLFYPELLRFRRGKIALETQSKITQGKTLLDSRHRPETGANAWVAIEVDAVNLLAVMSEDLKQLLARNN